MEWIIVTVFTLTFAFLKYPDIDKNNNVTKHRLFKSPRFPELILFGFISLVIINVIFFSDPFSMNGTIIFLSFVIVLFNIMNFFFYKLLLTKSKKHFVERVGKG
ncbi:hypothetical protein P4645_15350 [Lysinibacillus fusiformis]|uniref:hypothetical protein n=1 Tax=Lysinibacillus fusiformis TaxID=28031 RepID=UPI002E250C17|nr:hypothetical protein [Lysinibacillus fusiformis]